MNELKELLIKAFNLELDDSQDAEPNTYLFNYEYDVTDALNTAVQLIETYTTKKELEARLDELVKLKQAHSIYIFDEYLEKHITQLSTELKTLKEIK